MPKSVIERGLLGAGTLSAKELQGIAQKSCGVLQEIGPSVQWIHSYVTGDKIYCIYIGPDLHYTGEFPLEVQREWIARWEEPPRTATSMRAWRRGGDAIAALG